jgi:hypothetical protein
MFSDFFALPDTVWAPILEQKQTAVDLSTREGCEEVLSLYNRAEEDYLCTLVFIVFIWRVNVIQPQLYASLKNTPSLFWNNIHVITEKCPNRVQRLWGIFSHRNGRVRPWRKLLGKEALIQPR